MSGEVAVKRRVGVGSDGNLRSSEEKAIFEIRYKKRDSWCWNLEIMTTFSWELAFYIFSKLEHTQTEFVCLFHSGEKPPARQVICIGPFG